MGRICKVQIDRINKVVCSKPRLMQWTNTDQVLIWFVGLCKKIYRFFKFDVVDFYHSISEELVTKSLKIAEKYTNIPTEDLVLIKNACKSMRYERGNLWRKKSRENNNSLFDVTQGSYLAAELCKLVGLFVLSWLKDISGAGNVGL